MAAIVLLVLHAVGSWAYAALGTAAAIVSATLVAAISMFSARMAGLGQGNNAWFVVPTVVEFTPFLVGFAGPVLLLLIAYWELGRLRIEAKKKGPWAGSLSESR